MKIGREKTSARWEDTLPEGVPADNRGDSSAERRFFAAQNVSTPIFINNASGDAALNEPTASFSKKRVVDVRITEENDDEDDESADENSNAKKESRPSSRDNSEQIEVLDHPYPHGIFLILFAIFLIFMALGAIVYVNNRQDTPYCSQQPVWNQYNCLPG